jgi:hypothetical protein
MDETEGKRGPGRPSRRGVRGLAGLSADPIENAIRADSQNTADELQAALIALGGVAESGVQIIVYKVPEKGSWQFIKELQPPFSVTGLANELETHYGPGKYAIRILANDKIRTTKFIEIAATKQAQTNILGVVNGAAGGGFNQVELLKMLLERKTDDGGSKELFMLMMNMQQTASQNMMQMQMESTKMVVSLMTALMTGRADPAEQFAKIGSLLKDMQAPPQTLKETLEILTVAKDFVGGGDTGDGLLNLAGKVLPTLASMAEAGARGAAQPGAGQGVQPYPPPRALPPPISRAPPPAIPGAGPPANDAPPAAGGPPAHPILDLVRLDIEYFMGRGHDPELAADALSDILHAHQVTREQLLAFGMEIQGTDGDFVGRLRALGLDVSAHTEWFIATLTALADYDDEPDRGGDELADGDEPDPGDGGPGGSAADPGPDAGAGPAGRPADPRPKQGGAAH